MGQHINNNMFQTVLTKSMGTNLKKKEKKIIRSKTVDWFPLLLF
jgi:hypothetical protein